MNRKGFTLIEIIAVLLVISLMAVVITPKIVNAIENSKKGNLATSFETIARAIQNETNFSSEEVEYTLINDKMSPSLQIENKIKGNGTITLKKDGNIEMMIDSDGYCVYKSSLSSKVIVTKGACDSNLSDYTLTLIPGRITNHSINVVANYQGNANEYLYKKGNEEYVTNNQVNNYTYEELEYNKLYELQGKVMEENGTYAISKVLKVRTIDVPNIKITKKVSGINVYAVIDFTELKEGYTYRYSLDKGEDTSFQEVEAEDLTNGKIEVLIPDNDTNVTAQIKKDSEGINEIFENVSMFFEYMDETDYTITLVQAPSNGTISTNQSTSKYKKIVSITTTPNTNYTIDTLTYNGTSFAPATSSDQERVVTFTMPRENTTVRVAWKLNTVIKYRTKTPVFSAWSAWTTTSCTAGNLCETTTLYHTRTWNSGLNCGFINWSCCGSPNSRGGCDCCTGANSNDCNVSGGLCCGHYWGCNGGWNAWGAWTTTACTISSSCESTTGYRTRTVSEYTYGDWTLHNASQCASASNCDNVSEELGNNCCEVATCQGDSPATGCTTP